MARPTKQAMTSGVQGWDAVVEDNFDVLLSGPIPIHIHTGDESDITATFPVAAYEDCFAIVNHTTLGTCLYVCDGTAWRRILRFSTIAAVTGLTDSTGGSANDALVAISGSGADAAINDNFADLAAKVNELIVALEGHGLIT